MHSRFGCARRDAAPWRLIRRRGGRPPERPRRTGRAALLEVRDIALRFGGIVALDGVSFALERGPDPGPDRSERRRQDDAVQLHQPPLHAEPRRHPVRRAARCSTGRRIASPRSASPAPFRTWRCSARKRVLDNVRIGGHARCRGDFLTDALRLPVGAAAGGGADRDRLGAARACSICARWRCGRRPGCRSAPASGSSWRARWPHARSCCCSTSRPAGSTHERGRRARRADPAHPRRAAGHRAARRASHGLVMSVSDKVVALDFGRKIAEGTPAAVQQDAAVIGAYLGTGQPHGARSRAMMLEVSGLDAFYGEDQALYGVGFALDEGRCARCSAPTAPARRPCCARCAAWSAPAARSASTGKPDRRLGDRGHRAARHRACAGGPRHVCRALTVEENLQLGAMTRRDRAGIAADIEQVYAHFPRLKERRAQQAGTLSGGEQQMLAVGRALMLRPRLMLLDEPSFGLAPLVVEELFAILRRVNRETRGGDADRRAERRAGARPRRTRLPARNRPHRHGRARPP